MRKWISFCISLDLKGGKKQLGQVAFNGKVSKRTESQRKLDFGWNWGTGLPGMNFTLGLDDMCFLRKSQLFASLSSHLAKLTFSCEELWCFGLGHIAGCVSARFQLALLLLIRFEDGSIQKT